MPAVVRAAAGGTTALALLLTCAPSPAAAVAQLRALPGATDPTAPLVAAVALSAWVLAAWLAAAVLLALTSRAPGLLGRASAALARRWAPTAVRRSLEIALGLTVATGALATGTAHASPSPTPTTDAVSFDLDWPTSGPTPAPPAAGPAKDVRDPGRAAQGAATRPSPPPSPGRGGAATVVVRPGDTLWALAEASLRRAGAGCPSDARIAQTWPRWWAANRDVIGDDPDLIRPGTVLSPPAERAADATAGP